MEDIDQGDSWAQTLQKITAERDKAQNEAVALSGRGVKRRAAAVTMVSKLELRNSKILNTQCSQMHTGKSL